MKNSKEYSQKVHKLYRSLKHKYPKPQKVIYDEPVDALVYAIVSENINGTAAQSAIKRFADYFVDWNDLRVSRAEEVVELLKEDTPVTRDIAWALTTALRAVFDKYHIVSMEPLKKIGKRPARQVLEKMESISRFTVNYCMLTALQGHAMPLTKKMIEYLRNNQMVYPDADELEIEGFLTKQTSAENAYEFYALLRRQSEERKARRKEKITLKTKTKTTKAGKKTKRTKK